MQTSPNAVLSIDQSQDGIPMITGSRVPLATLVTLIKRGETSEAIVDKFPRLSLASVKGAIDQYLNRREEWDHLLAANRYESQKTKVENESRFEFDDFLDCLLITSTGEE